MLLALRVPPSNERGPLYMDQALATIHQANPSRLPLALTLTRHGDAVTLTCRVPDDLGAIVESQLYAAYPDAHLEALPDDALLARPEHRVWTTELRLVPDLYPIKRYAQFEDPLNRVSADPLTALLTTLTA